MKMKKILTRGAKHCRKAEPPPFRAGSFTNRIVYWVIRFNLVVLCQLKLALYLFVSSCTIKNEFLKSVFMPLSEKLNHGTVLALLTRLITYVFWVW